MEPISIPWKPKDTRTSQAVDIRVYNTRLRVSHLNQHLDSAILRLLTGLTEETGVDRIYFPSLSKFNAQISHPANFEQHKLLQRESITADLWIGHEADGIILPAGTAAFFTTADAHTVVVSFPARELVIAAQAGFASLIDQQRILTGQPSREHESVIDSIMEIVGTVDPEERCDYHILCGIGPQHFSYPPDHPQFGSGNIKILEELHGAYGSNVVPDRNLGRISLHSLIEHQFRRYGLEINEFGYDHVDTYSDMEDGKHVWASNRRVKEAAREIVEIPEVPDGDPIVIKDLPPRNIPSLEHGVRNGIFIRHKAK